MTFAGRTPGIVFRDFADYLNFILSRTLTRMPLIVSIPPGSTRASLDFRPGGNSGPVPIQTAYGELGLELGQPIQVIRHDARHHFQSPMPTGLERDGRATLLQELHLPTGQLSIEEVIRFCLNAWHQMLTESYERTM